MIVNLIKKNYNVKFWCGFAKFTFFLLLLFIGGCSVISGGLKGKPPMDYPIDISDEKIISDMKNHLEIISTTNPNEDVLSIIYLKKNLSYEEAFSIVQDYNLKVGRFSSISIKTTEDGHGGVGILVQPMNLEEFKAPINEIFESLSSDNVQEDMIQIKPVSVSGLKFYSTPKNLLKMLTEQSEFIRAIGIVGDKSSVPARWKPVDPEASFR
jgi:hypothetical protein